MLATLPPQRFSRLTWHARQTLLRHRVEAVRAAEAAHRALYPNANAGRLNRTTQP